MKFKQKFKQMISSYSFWTTLAGALALVASAIGRAFCIKVEEQIVTDIVMAIAGVLVAVGIVSKPTTQSDGAEVDGNEPEVIQDDSTSPVDQTEQNN